MFTCSYEDYHVPVFMAPRDKEEGESAPCDNLVLICSVSSTMPFRLPSSTAVTPALRGSL
jgi:hypothetical protein